MEYNFRQIEDKWQKIWDKTNRFAVNNKEAGKENKYVLAEFPYPSGKGLHLGHIFTFTAPDILSRLLKLKGYNVLFPYGLDAFGLEAERAAIKQKITPQEVVEKNKATFKEQVKLMGYAFDWDREIDTSDPEYYKWTQWLFLQFFKMGQAYKGYANVNFCPNCGVLANEEVEEGKCCQCASETFQKEKAQWLFKITDYAERLISDLSHTDYFDYVKTSQINYIGKSTGVNVKFKTNVNVDFEIFTTCIETIYGITFMVIAPDGKILDKLKPHIENWEEAVQYIKITGQKTAMERTSLNKDKTGVELKGITAINPVNNKEVPVFISDFVLGEYGTGAVMAVPSHDQRDYEFAKKFNLEFIQVIEGDVSKEAVEKGVYLNKNSKLLNSAEFSGQTVSEAKKNITEKLIKMKIAKETVNYQLHDWVFARQRYWGEPIPIINCEKCGLVPVADSELPLTLPPVINYDMNKEGESPLAEIAEFVNCTCPKCKGKAKRETDTMPGWAGSSWYFYRFLDPKNKKEFVSKDALKAFPVVDYYFGGNEHTTRHLLYARYWTKMLYDLKLVDKDEFCDKRYSHGLILGADGTKMSKSRGNVIDPRDMIKKYGTDALRIGIMFIGDYQATFPFNENVVMAANKFLSRSLSLIDSLIEGTEVRKELAYAVNTAIKKVDEDVTNVKYNTAIAALMTLLNEFKKQASINKKELEIYLTLLAPFAPHLAEEMWVLAKLGSDMTNVKWTNYDEKALILDEINIPVQVNGKLKTTLMVNRDIKEEELVNLAKEKLGVADVKKVIYVPAKILNLIV